ncbi:hypothetical protein PHYPSEUDO_012085 [Phytophthora pseudosyringae]|uniref:Uncharacterized protein n=1 Tax=Phytophthora pseudosyringae TaxID=221518 RepID=A0A8T1W8P8_9STRA|nr:hypothetical protein PHYPSEUDO_012085 [Phytophthora pseudosyringae]
MGTLAVAQQVTSPIARGRPSLRPSSACGWTSRWTCSQTPAMLLVADFAGDRQTLGRSSDLGPDAGLTLRYFIGMLCVVKVVCVAVAVFFGKETPLLETDY